MKNRNVSTIPFCLLAMFALAGSIDCGQGSSGGGGGGTGPGGSSGPSVVVPGFLGAGTTAGIPLLPGTDPATARDCAGAGGPIQRPTRVITQTTQCYYRTTTTTTSTPAATVEQITEVLNGKNVLHLRVIFDPGFVDNSYGEGAIGWEKGGPMPMPMPPKPGRGHTFKDLVGSDHVELKLLSGNGQLALHFKVDYISVDATRPCGYGTLGVAGGEGKMLAGNAAAVLAVATSLDRNLNGCGYCATVDSPLTDATYTPNPATPRWDYRVVYEMWVDAGTFGPSGVGDIVLENVHASPAKGDSNTVSVKKGDCPPTWPECKPDIITEGLNCGDAGAGCPPGTIEYVISEGRTCLPIPIPMPDGGLGCPNGYHLDVASEGRICLPN